MKKEKEAERKKKKEKSRNKEKEEKRNEGKEYHIIPNKRPGRF